MRALALTIAIMALTVAPVSSAWAHRLIVFASVNNGQILVETKFSNGKRPVSGKVTVKDEQSKTLKTLALGKNGQVVIPVADLKIDGGVSIEVETSEGHNDYWILTPADLAGSKAGEEPDS